jgi:hypothetical protein
LALDITNIHSPTRVAKFEVPETLYDFHVIVDRMGYHHIYAISKTPETEISITIFKSEYHDSPFAFGDVDNDEDIDLVDMIKLSNYTGNGINYPILLNACDVNCDGEINLDDVDYMIDYLFRGGPEPGTDCEFYIE